MKMKRLQRWIAGCMAYLMITGMVQLSPPVRAAESPPDDSLTVFDKLGFDTGIPEGYREEEPITDTPYGRQFVTVNPVDELMLIEGLRKYTFYGVDEKMEPLKEANEAYFQDESRKRVSSDDNVTGSLGNVGVLAADALIALEGNFCVSNHGKRANTILVGLETTLPEDKGDAWVHGKMYVAAIGRYIQSNGTISTVFDNRACNLFGPEKPFRIGNDHEAVRLNEPSDPNEQHDEGDFSESYMAYNYLAAATGDFDADGIDEIAWYLPEAMDPRIEIWDLQNSDSSDPNETSAFLYSSNWELAQVFRLDTDGRRIAPDMVSLVTSDLNRDGADDLAITWGKASQTSMPSKAAVLWGDTLNENENSSMLAEVTEIPLLTGKGYEIDRASFAVGDADGDGYDDLILGGSCVYNNPCQRYLTGYRWNGKEFVQFIEKYIDLKAKNNKGEYICHLEMGGDGKTDLSRNYYSTVSAKANVAVGQFFGPGESPGIYFDGMMFANTADGLNLVDIMTPNDINAHDSAAGTSYAYVEREARAATLGTDGRDTLIITSQYLFHNMEGRSVPDSDYFRSISTTDALITHRLYKNQHNLMRENFRTLNAFNFSTWNNSEKGKVYEHERILRRDSGSYARSALTFSLPNMDDDTIYMAYTGEHYYRYADPEVVAVLASPPYFKDLTQIDGDLDDSSMVESSTKYGASTGSGTGSTTTSGFSAGIYMGMEQDIKFMGITLASYEMEAEINNHFTWETENIREVNYQITYENALGQDGVALCAMPVETYVYKSYSPDGQGGYQETDITVNIPYEPSVRVIDLKQYQQIYEDYKDVLPKVDGDVLSHTLGDPRSYPSSLDELPPSLQVMSYPGDPSEIGQGGKSSITQTIEMTNESSQSFNYEFELNFKMGGGIGGMKAGVTGGMNFGSGSVHVSTSGSTYESTMLALPSIAADYGYSFNWRLVGFLYNGSNAFNPFAKQYPVVTYLVTSERVPPHLPENFRVNDEGTTSDAIELTWDYTGAAAGFIIYRYFESTSGSDFYEIATVGYNEGVPQGDGSSCFSFVDQGLEPDSPFAYRIQTIGNAMPNLSVPSGTLNTFTKPVNHPVVKVTQDNLKAYPDSEVSVTAFVENAGAGSYEYSWQQLVGGEWKTLTSVSRPQLSGMNTNTMTISYGDENYAGAYRCQVVKRTTQSKILRAYSPVVTVDFDRRTPALDGDITINDDKSISVRLKGTDTTALPGGNVTITLSRDSRSTDFQVPLNIDGVATLSDFTMDPGVYSVSAYYGGNRVFKPLAMDPAPKLLYATGYTGTATFVDLKDTYTYGDPLEIVQYVVDDGGRIVSAEPITNLERDSLEVMHDGFYQSTHYVLLLSTADQLASGQAAWAGQFRLTYNGLQYFFNIEPLTVTVTGLEPYYMLALDQIPSLYSFMYELRENLVMTPEAPYREHNWVLEEWIRVKEYGGKFLDDFDEIGPGHYNILADPGMDGSKGIRNNYRVICPDAELIVTGAAHKLNLNVYYNKYTRGSIRAVNPKDAQYATAGQTVLLEALPNPGFEVYCWYLNGEKIEGSEGKTALGFIQGDTDSDVAVRFEYRQNTLTIKTDPEAPMVNGESVINEVLVDDELFFNGNPCATGRVLNLTPKAAEGWHFDKWEYLEEGQSTEYIDTPTLQVTMPDASVLIRATFARDTYTLTLGENLTAFDAFGKPLTDIDAITGDTEVTVRVADGFRKAQEDQAWTVNGTASDAIGDSVTLTLLENTAVDVPTVAGKYNVSVYAEGLEGGSASVTPSGMVSGGTKVTFTAETERDYSFLHWDFGGGRLVEDNPYTAAVEGNMNATPVLGPREGKTIFVYGQVDWNISGLYTQPDYGEAPRIYPGESLTITAFPGRGEIVAGWYIDGIYTAKPGTELTIAYEEAVDGMYFMPYYQPSTMVKITTVSPYIQMVQGDIPVESGDYVAINSEVVCTFAPPPEYQKENNYLSVDKWLVNGKTVPGARTNTLVLKVENPTTVDVTTLDKLIHLTLKETDAAEYFDWTMEFSQIDRTVSDSEWYIPSGSSLTFTAKIKRKYRYDKLYIDTVALENAGLVEKDGEWIYYEEYIQCADSGNHRIMENPLDKVSVYKEESVEFVTDGNGTITADHDTYVPMCLEANREMVITVHPNDGYQLQSLNLEYDDLNNGVVVEKAAYLDENGNYAFQVVENEYHNPARARVIATFCPDTPQPVTQIVLREGGAHTMAPDEVYQIPYRLLPANNNATVEWLDCGSRSGSILISPDGTIRRKQEYQAVNSSDYMLRVTNSDGTTLERRSYVTVPKIYDEAIMKFAVPPHIKLDLSEAYMANSPVCNHGKWLTIGLTIEEGYVLDKIEGYMINSHTPVLVEPVTDEPAPDQTPNTLRYKIWVPVSDVMMVITEKPADGTEAVQPHTVTCLNSDEHMSLRFIHEKAYAGETVKLQTNFYLPESDSKKLSELIPEVGYELDLAATTIIGDATGTPVAFTLNERDELCFVMPDESVTITPVTKVWETDPRHTLTIVNGTANGQNTVKLFPTEAIDVQCDQPADYHVFTGWTTDVSGVRINGRERATVFDIKQDTTLTANYRKAYPKPIGKDCEYRLYVTGGTGSGLYTPGQKLTVQAIIPPGKMFKQWYAEGIEMPLESYKNPNITFEMPEGNVNLHAAIVDAAPNVYTLTVVNGTGSGNHAAGSKVTARAVPPSGMAFASWNAEGLALTKEEQGSSTLVFVMPENHVVLRPVFEKASYTVSVTGGSGDGSYHPGETVTVKADAVPGHTFLYWTADGIELQDPKQQTVTFTMPSGPVSLTAHFEEKVETATVTFRIVNGTWNGTVRDDQTVKVILRNGKGTLDLKQVPADMVPDKGFDIGKWDIIPVTAENGITGDVTYTYTFAKHIPVITEAAVTFKVVGGTWADGSADDKTVPITLTDGYGTLPATSVPLGMRANAGFEGGAWDTEPVTDEYGVTGDVTYTYTFTEHIPVITEATVTFRIVNGTWSDGTTADRTVPVTLADGLGTLPPTDIPTDMKPARAGDDGAWDTDPVTDKNGITGDVTYTYTFTEHVPVITGATVTFRIINGTWDGVDAADKQVEVILTDGKGTLLPEQVPADMVPNKGHENGQWVTAPNTEQDATTGDRVYIFVFARKAEAPAITVVFTHRKLWTTVSRSFVVREGQSIKAPTVRGFLFNRTARWVTEDGTAECTSNDVLTYDDLVRILDGNLGEHPVIRFHKA